MNPFESRIRNKVETVQSDNIIDTLLAEFPEELQQRLEQEIEDMDEQGAENYLIQKLSARKESLVEWSLAEVSKFVEISHDIPLAVVESIKHATTAPENALGEGKNGRVYASLRRDFACYKILFLERAREFKLSIIREAVMQHSIAELAKKVPNGAKVPDVLGFVERPDMLAVMMDKIDGNSFLQIFEGKAELPPNFDINAFFERLETTVNYLNENGYFHRDLVHKKGPYDAELTPNSGNVMVDKEGNPWLIDFGSSVKAFNADIERQTYQLHPTTGPMLANDISGIHFLKERVMEYVRHKKGQ